MSDVVTTAPSTNRSSEELAMRDAIELWGRTQYPGCRVVHELVTGQCRIDVAFIQVGHLAGVEIKSSRDVLDRLDKQVETFRRHIPEVWIAIAPKWVEHALKVAYDVGRLVATSDQVKAELRDEAGKMLMYRHPAKRIESLTVPMLDLLWRSELHAMAARAGIWSVKGKPSRPVLINALARKLTGDELVAGVCRELRARDAFWKADPPIKTEGVSAADLSGHLDLFRDGAITPATPPGATP